MDVIWTGEFANAGWITPFPDEVAKAVTEDVFPSVVKTAEFEGQLYAAPLWSNTSCSGTGPTASTSRRRPGTR